MRIKAKKSKLWERNLGFGFSFGQILPMLSSDARNRKKGKVDCDYKHE